MPTSSNFQLLFKPHMNLTIPLSVYIDAVLGITVDDTLHNRLPSEHLWDSRPIPVEIAEVIFALCNNEHTCYIQFPTEFSLQKEPILWSWKAWKASQEDLEKQKAYSHKRRVDKYLYEANVEMMTKAAVKKFGFDENKARAMALRWVSQGNNGALFICGISEYKKKEEEL